MDQYQAVKAAPHPIPYQGSKRRLAARILAHAPGPFERVVEPFAGSAAITIAAARAEIAPGFVLNDSLRPLAELWRAILHEPTHVVVGYEAMWIAQLDDPRAAYERVRRDFNRDHDPIGLLYLLARCVKGAVRFNRDGEFNQSADHRRLGARPETMRRHIEGAHALLHDRTEVRAEDFEATLERASPADLVYMDPPYAGTTRGRDRRYHAGLDVDRFVAALHRANERGLRYLVSYDGHTGARTYGPPLPSELGLRRIELPAGRSSQATLTGRDERTVESLYLSVALQG